MLSSQFNSAAQGQHARTQETPTNSKPQADSYQRVMTEKPYHTGSDNKHPRPALQSIPPFRDHHPAPSPPHNFSHDPSNFFSTVTPGRESEWENDPLSGRSTILRPPRPPFLTPWSHSMNQGTDSVSVSRSPPRVKCSPVPPRPSLPDFLSQPSSRHADSNGNNRDHNPVSSGVSSKDVSTTFDFPKTESCCSHESESIYSQESALPSCKDERRIAVVISDLNEKPSTYKHSHPSPVLVDTTELNSSSLEGKYTVVERSEIRPRTPHYSTTTSRQPPFAKSGASQMKSEFTRDDMESSLTLLPAPSPLFIRKRPEPLVLPRTPTVVPVHLPPSPAFTSIDSTPPSTPTSYSSASWQLRSSSPVKNTAIRAFHRTSPPTTSPPSSPLPTPPYDATSALQVFTLAGGPRTLLSAQSTTDLQDLRDLRVERRKLASAHGTTSSTLISGIHFPGDDSGRRANSRRPATATYLQSRGRVAPSKDNPMQWGNAL